MALEYDVIVKQLAEFNIKTFIEKPCEYLILLLENINLALLNEEARALLLDSKETIVEISHFADKLIIANDSVLFALRDQILLKEILKLQDFEIFRTSFKKLDDALSFIRERIYPTRLSMLHPELDPILSDFVVKEREDSVKREFDVWQKANLQVNTLIMSKTEEMSQAEIKSKSEIMLKTEEKSQKEIKSNAEIMLKTEERSKSDSPTASPDKMVLFKRNHNLSLRI